MDEKGFVEGVRRYMSNKMEEVQTLQLLSESEVQEP